MEDEQLPSDQFFLKRFREMTDTIVLEGEYDDSAWYSTVKLNGNVLTPEKSIAVRNHSPTGFAWGYAGSGPAQLALAVCLAMGLDVDHAQQVYQRFKADWIQNLPRASFRIEIPWAEWLKLRGGQ